MPGIAGGYCFGAASFPDQLIGSLGECLRASETQPVYSGSDGRVGLAVCCPEAADLESRAAEDPSTGVRLLLDGEVYGRGAGNGPVPASALLGSYLRRGVDVFGKWNGRFAAAILDPRDGELHIATDRHGTQPLYIVIEPDRVLFSTSIAALCSDPRWKRDVDPHALMELLSFGCLQGDRTLFQRVRALEAATVISVGHRGVRRRRYWNLADHLRRHASSDLSDDLEALRRAFNRAVLRRADPARASILLSGGLDSRCILSACIASELPLHAFTYGCKQSDDVRIARELASCTGIPWKHLPLSDATVYTPRHLRAHVRATGGTLSAVHSLGIGAATEIGSTESHLLLGNGAEVTRGGIFDCPSQGHPVGMRIGELWSLLTRRFNVAFPLAERHGVLRDEVYWQCRDLPGDGVREALRALSDIDPERILDGYFLQERARRYLNSGGPVFFGSEVSCRFPFYDLDYLDLCLNADRRAWGSTSLLARHIIRENESTLSKIPTTFSLSMKGGPIRSGLERRLARAGRWIRRRIGRSPKRSIPCVSVDGALRQQRAAVTGWLENSIAVEMGLFDAGKIRTLLDEHFERGRHFGRRLGAALTVELFLREFVAPDRDPWEEVLELVAHDVAEHEIDRSGAP